MAEFDLTGLTQLGEAAVMQAVLGNELTFTRIALGDGFLPEGAVVDEMTELVHECASVDVMNIKTHPENIADVSGTYINDSQLNGFWWRELGLYAKAPGSDNEVLFAYANAGDHSEWIPATNETTSFEKSIDMIVYVGRSESVNLEMIPASFATHEEVDAAIDTARYTLPEASAVRLGGVKVGQGVSVDEDGTISVELPDSPIQFKGTVSSKDELPTEGNKSGYMYIVGSAAPYKEFFWTGSAWEELGIFDHAVNAEDFVMKSEVLTDEDFLIAIGATNE